MLRLGFFVGFLLGAAAGALLSQQQEDATPSGLRPMDGLRASLGARFEEARQAAKEGARDKEDQMLRDFEKATHPEKGESA